MGELCPSWEAKANVSSWSDGGSSVAWASACKLSIIREMRATETLLKVVVNQGVARSDSLCIPIDHRPEDASKVRLFCPQSSTLIRLAKRENSSHLSNLKKLSIS